MPQLLQEKALERFFFRQDELPGKRNKTANRTLEDQDDHDDQYLRCIKCGHPITSLALRTVIQEKHQHTFFNPAGLVFEICCFQQAPGVVASGTPSGEFSWFSGFLWQVVFCSRCRSHMGWRFSSGHSSFFGLIKNRLTQQMT